jgi:hypothetical protein
MRHLVLEGYIYKYGDHIGNKLFDQGAQYTEETIGELVDFSSRYPVIRESTSIHDPYGVVGYADVFKKKDGVWARIVTNDQFSFERIADYKDIINSIGLGFYAVGSAEPKKNDFKLRTIMLIPKKQSFHEIEAIHDGSGDISVFFQEFIEENYKKRVSATFNNKDMTVTYKIFDMATNNELSEIKACGEEGMSVKPLLDELERLDEKERRTLDKL